MRALPLVIALLVATSTAARAYADEDPDGDFIPLKKRSIGVSLQAHGTRLGGQSESGFGPTLELALAGGRWQYFVEAGFATAGVNAWTTGAVDMRINGRMARGALGTRWLARQFRSSSSGGFELFLLSALGLQRLYMDDNTRLTRPELALGVGVQMRLYKKPRIAVRLDARVLFTPSDDAEHALAACRVHCMAETGSSTGFISGFAFAW